MNKHISEDGVIRKCSTTPDKCPVVAMDGESYHAKDEKELMKINEKLLSNKYNHFSNMSKRKINIPPSVKKQFLSLQNLPVDKNGPSSEREGETEFIELYKKTKWYTPEKVVRTADNILFTTDDKGEVMVLMIERKNPPFQGYLCLPGGFVDPGEDSETASLRELNEETGVELSNKEVHKVGTYDEAYRDPRMPKVSTSAFTTFIPNDKMPKYEAGDDAAKAMLIPVRDVMKGKVGFDHKQILSDAITLFVK